MCHWVLRVWKCGDSFFTKYSSCSFDRAGHDPSNLLNPLHPSITPIGTTPCPPRPLSDAASTSGATQGSKMHSKSSNKSNTKPNSNKRMRNSTEKPANETITAKPCLPQASLPTIDLSSPGSTCASSVGNGSEAVYPRDVKTGEMIPIPLSEIGKASRFGDKSLGQGGKCNVFEVVLQTRETTMCPACARSPKRARLPAHARGCFGLS